MGLDWNAWIGQEKEPEEEILPPIPPPVIDEAIKESVKEDLELERLIFEYRRESKVTLPASKTIDDYPESIVLDPELIEGVLRVGQIFMFSGASKAGKSFFMIELALSIATGRKLLDKFQCKEGKVLLLNLEINENSYEDRLEKVAGTFGLTRSDYSKNLYVKHMRGMNVFLPDITDELIASMLEDQLNDPERRPYSAIIIDPIYKVMDGEENSARDVGNFFNLLDKISKVTKAAVFITHHHSKGFQGEKKSQDRASGSGVFARSPDVVCDVITLAVKTETRDALHNSFMANQWRKLLDALTDEWDENVTESQKEQAQFMADHYRTMSGISTYKMKKLRADFEMQFDEFIDNMVPMRFEFTLRDFKPIKPVNVFFHAPVHALDRDNVLSMADPETQSFEKKHESASDRRRHTLNSFRECVDALIEEKGEATYGEVMTKLGISRNTLKTRLFDLEDVYESVKGGGSAKSVIRYREKSEN